MMTSHHLVVFGDLGLRTGSGVHFLHKSTVLSIHLLYLYLFLVGLLHVVTFHCLERALQESGLADEPADEGVTILSIIEYR